MTNNQPLKLNDNLCIHFRDVCARKFHKRIAMFSEVFASYGPCWASAPTLVSLPYGGLGDVRDTGGGFQSF